MALGWWEYENDGPGVVHQCFAEADVLDADGVPVEVLDLGEGPSSCVVAVAHTTRGEVIEVTPGSVNWAGVPVLFTAAQETAIGPSDRLWVASQFGLTALDGPSAAPLEVELPTEPTAVRAVAGAADGGGIVLTADEVHAFDVDLDLRWSTPVEFDPFGLAIGPDDAVWVGGQATGSPYLSVVERLSPGGVSEGFVDEAEGTLVHEIDIDPSGLPYLLFEQRGEGYYLGVQALDADGTPRWTAELARGARGERLQNRLAIDNDGNVVVAADLDREVKKLSGEDGSTLWRAEVHHNP